MQDNTVHLARDLNLTYCDIHPFGKKLTSTIQLTTCQFCIKEYYASTKQASQDHQRPVEGTKPSPAEPTGKSTRSKATRKGQKRKRKARTTNTRRGTSTD